MRVRVQAEGSAAQFASMRSPCANHTEVADATIPEIAKHCGSRGLQYLEVKNSPPCVTRHQTADKKGLHFPSR
ncbi:hypothetical protein IG631_09181 [Alternaria alternata]|nr:hypothetical protein IG631_09181 [Alternaria alternata]